MDESEIDFIKDNKTDFIKTVSDFINYMRKEIKENKIGDKSLFVIGAEHGQMAIGICCSGEQLTDNIYSAMKSDKTVATAIVIAAEMYVEEESNGDNETLN